MEVKKIFKLSTTEDKIIKYIKDVAVAEEFLEVKVKFIKMYISGRKCTYGKCSRGKKIIKINRVFPFLLEHRKYCGDYRQEVWETMLHEIAHLNDTEFSLTKLRELKDHNLRKGEYLDLGHDLFFWKYLRKLRMKYSKKKKQFMQEVSYGN